MKLDPSQSAAIDAACGGRDHVITGGAGTGKTTIVRHLYQRLGAAQLLAPTGKAAALLRQRTGIPAQTVHRWLMWDGTTVRRQDLAHQPVIIDEASMVDSWLLARVLEFAPPQLVLVGDAAQLPPVGRGAPFHDTVAMRPDLVSTLTTCHRARGAIHQAARTIRDGQMPPERLEGGGEVWQMIDSGGPESTQRKLLAWVDRGAFDPEQDVVLACRNGEGDDHPGTVRMLNAEILARVNPHPFDTWGVGDRVMNLKNFAELDWFNGDTGSIGAVAENGNLWVQPDRGGDQIELDKEARKELTHAYAVTVHKSQGSQYRRVFVLLFRRDLHMLNRNLIYTAVTRAQKGVVVMGELGAMRAGLREVAHKSTVIQALARQADPNHLFEVEQ